MSRSKQTTLFVVLALGLSYGVFAMVSAVPSARWLIQFLMWCPAVAALILQAIRREPPRALGFSFTGWAPWVVAFLYPFGVIAACVLLAFALQAASGSDLIHWQPDAVRLSVFGADRVGLQSVPWQLACNLAPMTAWLAVALAYRLELPERLGAGRHAARALLWLAVVESANRRWWVPPGFLGEELGWRGWLVRVWRDRPVAAFAISAPVWMAFHLPVLIMAPELRAPLHAAGFLLSIGTAAAAYQALYLWSGSVWPPAILHFTWNLWNPLILGDQYGGKAALFGGATWLTNGEGVLGMVVQGAVAGYLLWYWRRQSTRTS